MASPDLFPSYPPSPETPQNQGADGYNPLSISPKASVSPGTPPPTPLGRLAGNPPPCNPNSPDSPRCYAQQVLRGYFLYNNKTDSLKEEYLFGDEFAYQSPNIYYIQMSEIPRKRKDIEYEFPIPADLPKIITNTTGRNNNNSSSKLVLFYIHGDESFQKEHNKRIHPILSKICACLKLGTNPIPYQSYCEMEYQQIFLDRLFTMTDEYHLMRSSFLPLFIAEINIKEVENMRLLFMQNNDDIRARTIKDREFQVTKLSFIDEISNTSYEMNKEMLLEVTLEFGRENIKEDTKDKDLIRLLLMKIEELTKRIMEQSNEPHEGNTVVFDRGEGGEGNPPPPHTSLRRNAQFPRTDALMQMPDNFTNFADLYRNPQGVPPWSPSFLTPAGNGGPTRRHQPGPAGGGPMNGGSRNKYKKTLKASNRLKKNNKKTRKVKSRK